MDQIVVKSINLLDHVVYSNPNGFTIFRNAGGLEALTDRIQVRSPSIALLFTRLCADCGSLFSPL